MARHLTGTVLISMSIYADHRAVEPFACNRLTRLTDP